MPRQVQIDWRSAEPSRLRAQLAFYHPDLELTTNGETQDLAAFMAGHAAVYPTPISYRVEFDEEAWVESASRVAARVWITVERPDEPAVRIEVLFIATVRDGLIDRLWELTWPDWSRLDAFDSYHGP